MKKKILLSILVIFCAFCLTGCGNEKTKDEDYTVLYKKELNNALGSWKIVDTSTDYEYNTGFGGETTFLTWTLQFTDYYGNLTECDIKNITYSGGDNITPQILKCSENVLSNQNTDKLYQIINKDLIEDFVIQLNSTTLLPKNINIDDIKSSDISRIYIKVNSDDINDIKEIANKVNDLFKSKYKIYVTSRNNKSVEYIDGRINQVVE